MGLKDLFSGLNPLDTLSNLFKTGYNIYQDQRDYNYQKDLQKELFARDDNALQRRMLDAQKAGINPLFALGSGVGGVTSAGTMSSKPLSIDSNFYSNQQLKSQEKQAMEQEKKKREIEMKQMEINLRAGKIANWQAMQDLNTKRLEQDILKEQIKQMQTSGIYPLSGFGKNYTDFVNLVLPGLQNFFNGFQNTIDNLSPSTKKVVDFLTNPNQTIEGFNKSLSATNEVKDKIQRFVDGLGKPVITFKPKYITEYEARVLRGNSDKKQSKSVIYGATHRNNTPEKYNKKSKF